MRFGAFLREFSRLRVAVLVSVLLATFAALLSVYKIGLVPPSLHPRDMTIAGASTHVLVDTPRSNVTDLRASVVNFEALTTRADLLGNVMASLPVREYIGRLAGIDPNRINATAPITANVPRSLTEPGSQQRVTDILKSTDHYRIDIAANPTVPVLDIYTEAPNSRAAVRLANASVEGLREYLSYLGSRQSIGAKYLVRLVQFGGAQGGVINGGAAIQIALLTFLTVFSISCALSLWITRVRRGWMLAGSGVQAQP